MKSIITIATILSLTAILVIPALCQAADKNVKNEIIMKIGNKVHLFHSGNVVVQKDITLNEVLPVYRVIGKSAQQKEVGAVKVLTFIGEHYFEAEIIKGKIKVGDIAKKDGTSLLVQPTK